MDPWRFVRGVAGELEQALGPDLVGVYLHGSLALGCFNPVRSDVDLLLVVRQRLRPKARRRVAELVLAQSSRPYPLELTALSVDDLRP